MSLVVRLRGNSVVWILRKFNIFAILCALHDVEQTHSRWLQEELQYLKGDVLGQHILFDFPMNRMTRLLPSTKAMNFKAFRFFYNVFEFHIFYISNKFLS